MPETKRSIIFATTPRSGSNYLLSLIRASGVIDPNGEMLTLRDELYQEIDLREKGLPISNNAYFKDPERYFPRIRNHFTNENGDFYIKLHNTQVSQAADIGLNIFEHLPNPLFIYLRRGDVLAQAISHNRALQDNKWVETAETKESETELTYDFVKIKHSLNTITSGAIFWERVFASGHTLPLRLTYEQLVDNPKESVKTVMQYLSVPISDKQLDTIKSSLKKQSDKTTEEWKSQFIIDMIEHNNHVINLNNSNRD